MIFNANLFRIHFNAIYIDALPALPVFRRRVIGLDLGLGSWGTKGERIPEVFLRILKGVLKKSGVISCPVVLKFLVLQIEFGNAKYNIKPVLKSLQGCHTQLRRSVHILCSSSFLLLSSSARKLSIVLVD